MCRNQFRTLLQREWTYYDATFSARVLDAKCQSSKLLLGKLGFSVSSALDQNDAFVVNLDTPSFNFPTGPGGPWYQLLTLNAAESKITRKLFQQVLRYLLLTTPFLFPAHGSRNSPTVEASAAAEEQG